LRRAVLAFSVVAVLTAGASAPVASAEARFRVIVNPQVKGNQIPRAALSSIFLGQASKWGDGSRVRPVDQSLRSSLRLSFTADVLQQDLVAVQVYWQREIMKGHEPPPVKSSDEEIVAFVASNPGAIGYVSPGMPIPDSVREVAVVD
jgi:ABC-type phosphate transport system substrate-binding protein